MPTEHDSGELQEIAEKIRTGEYFREAQNMYDTTIHDPMSERYFYMLVTALSLLILLISLLAADSLYPLQTSVPFIYTTNDIVEDVPHMQSLRTSNGESPSQSLLIFLVRNYVVFREEYDISKLEKDVSAVKSASSAEVFAQFRQSLDPHSPDSPITLYQRHTKRHIDIVSLNSLYDQDYGMKVVFEATLESKGEIKKSRWEANIAFSYSGVALDESKGKVKPFEFVVTKYNVKRLQDVK